MKKKVLTVLSLLFVVIVVSFSRFLDVGANVTADQGSSPSVSHDVPKRAEVSLGKTMDNESAFLVAPEEEEVMEVVAVVSEAAVETTEVVSKGEEEASIPDSIELFGSTYEKVTDEKFSVYINVASELEAGFYAIPNSDVFAIVKNGEVLFQMSTGIKAIPMTNVELLILIFEKTGELNLVGPIVDDIRKVASTGETISVEGENYTGYSVFIQDEWILVSF
ncbi:hypothetical protein M3175_11650 [Robertmurraya korlensis]|uniref:hypothetical protein n=1 Tax=Robertmurraya korlensis TaxID=519977 RepID=UPI00203A5A1F|nr:hypothetical protein [Robertmurraya korlensis]MCM3601389.1 hypothetical protein [Robertmurraya korlensis]